MHPTMLRALKGAPLAALIVLTTTRRAGPDIVSQWTGYDRKTSAKALQVLERMGLAETYGRYDAYQLTAAAIQLPLFTPSQLESGEGEFLPLPMEEEDVNTIQDARALTVNIKSSSSSSEGENLPLPIDLQPVADALTRLMCNATGFPYSNAYPRICHTVAADYNPFWIEQFIHGWIFYCQEHPKINVPGALILARLRDEQQPPPAYTSRAALNVSIYGSCLAGIYAEPPDEDDTSQQEE